MGSYFQTQKTRVLRKADPAKADAAKKTLEVEGPGHIWQSLALAPAARQAKLTVSQPDDPYELEADSIADKVMRMATLPSRTPDLPNPRPGTTQLRYPAIGTGKAQRKCGAWDEEEGRLQRQHAESQRSGIHRKSLDVSVGDDRDERQAAQVARKVVARQTVGIRDPGGINRNGNGPAQTTPEFQSKLESSKGSGESLARGVQIEMGGLMGADFSDIRVHTGNAAHELSESINARAFTLGTDIYFRRGEYRPETESGKSLLAHELVHTQQQAGIVRRLDFEFVVRGAEELMDITGVTSAVQTGENIYHSLTDTDEEFEQYMQAQLANEILALRGASGPSLSFSAAYYGLVAFAGAMNPLSLFLMPSVDSLWEIYVEGKLGYYNYLYNLGREYLPQKDKAGNLQQVKNPNYKKGGYASVFANQMKNMVNPLFVWGEVKGIFKGIGNWFVDLWEMIEWLVSFIPSSISDTWNLIVNQEPPPWMKTLTEHAANAAAWLSDNSDLLLDFFGEMVRNPDELKTLGKDLKAALKTGASSAAASAGAGVAKQQVTAMSMSAEEQGEMFGKAIGYLIPEIVIAIFTGTIVNWIKGAVLAFKGLWVTIRATKVMKWVFEMARWVGEVLGRFVKAISGLAKGKFAKIVEMFEDVVKYFKGLGKVEKEIELGENLAKAGKTEKAIVEGESKLKAPKEKKTPEKDKSDAAKDELKKAAAFVEAKGILAASNASHGTLISLQAQLAVVDRQYDVVKRFEYEPAPQAVDVYMIASRKKVGRKKLKAGEGIIVRRSRQSAFREAKRDAQIELNQHPSKVDKVKMTDMDGKTIFDKNGEPIWTREYHFKNRHGKDIVIQDHSAGHAFGQGGVGDQGAHFNVRPIENTRKGKVPGTKEHYFFDK